MDIPSRPVRYTLQFDLRPTDRSVRYCVVTSGGPLKATAMAAGRFEREAVDEREQIHRVVLVAEEYDFVVNSETDLMDYWEVS